VSFQVKPTSVLLSYYIPNRDPGSYPNCRLRVTTYVGFMEMGKTVTEKAVMYLVDRQLEKNFGESSLKLTCKCIIDAKAYLEDHPDVLKGFSYLQLFVDDLFYSGLSIENSPIKRESLKIYADIRHILEDLGFHGVLRLSFAGQYFWYIPPFFRRAPVLVFKDICTHERREKLEISRMLGKDVYEFLKEVTGKAWAWQDSIKRYSAVLKFGDPPFILDVGENPALPTDVIEVPVNYSGFLDVDHKERELESAIRVALYLRPELGHAELRSVLRSAGVKFGNHRTTKLFKAIKKELGVTPLAMARRQVK